MGNQLVEDDVAKLHAAVGFLRSEVQNFSDKIDDLKDSTVEEQRKVHDIVVAQSEAMRNLDRELRDIKPLVEDYREKRAEWRGARKLAAWLYGAAALAGGTVVAFIMKFLENWPTGQRPPH